jgi:hypothetical protein
METSFKLMDAKCRINDLWRHYVATIGPMVELLSDCTGALNPDAFTQRQAFDALVRAGDALVRIDLALTEAERGIVEAIMWMECPERLLPVQPAGDEAPEND